MRKGKRSGLTVGLLLTDMVAVAFALTVAYWLALPRRMALDNPQFYLLLTAGIPTAVALFALNRLYVLDELFEGSAEYSRITYGCTLMALGLIIFDFWGANAGELIPSRRLLGWVWLVSLMTLIATRFTFRRVIRVLRRRGMLVSRALIVGAGSSGIELARHFQTVKHAGVQVEGFVDEFLPAGTPVTDGLKVLGRPSRLAQVLEETGASEVIVVPSAMAWESFQDLIRTVAGIDGLAIRLVPRFRDVLATSVRLHQFGFTPLLTIERVRITGLDALLKVILDYGIALLILPLASLLLSILSALLAVTRTTPVRSMQALGRGGKAFRAFFLNTEGGSAVARAIRQTGLDRLPLLLNLLLGQMSMVGPRLVPETRRPQHEHWLPNLLTVKPGITGPWFVRMPQSLEDEMQLNLFYIRNYTIWLDIEILVRSLIRILTGHPVQQSEPKAVGHERASVYR